MFLPLLMITAATVAAPDSAAVDSGFLATATRFIAARAADADDEKSATPLTRAYMAPAVRLRQPVMVDSLGIKGAAYDVKSLLDEPLPVDLSHNPSAVIVEADSAGYYTFARPDHDYLAYRVEIPVRADRYDKLDVNVEGNTMYALYVNGAPEGRVDFFPPNSSDEVSRSTLLTMIPGQQYRIDVKVIVCADSLPDPRLKVTVEPSKGYDNVEWTSDPGGRRPFAQSDRELGCRVYNVSVSPDGKYLLTKYTDRFTRDRSRMYGVITDLNSGRVVADGVPVDLNWMPRGSRLYNVEKGRADYDVYVTEVPSMRRSLLVQGVPERNFTWSPTEDYLVYYKPVEGKKDSGPLRVYSDPDDRIPGNRDRQQIRIFRPESGVSETLLHAGRQVSVGDISPDGKKMLVSVADYDATTWPFYFSSVYEIDLGSMAVDTLVTHDASVRKMAYSPDGKKVFFTGGPDAFGGVGRLDTGHPIANSEDVQGFIMDLATRDVKPMTRDFTPALTDRLTWSRGDGMIYFIAENGFNLSLYRLDPKKGSIDMLPQGVSYIQRFSVADECPSKVAYYGQGAMESGRAYTVDRKGRLELVADPWGERAAEIDWGKLERFAFNTADGTEIEGFVTLPPGYDPEKKYPMIVYYYGGTSPTTHNTYSPYNAQGFAAQGYIVYQINPSGTTGYGQEFADRHVNAWGEYTADDILAGVDAVCRAYPAVDSTRIGCIGASYGGFMTQLLLTKSPIFRAAVSHAGISNVASYWGEGYWGYSYNALAAAESYPWTNPEIYSRNSSLYNADKIHTPLLLTHGTADHNVPIGESIQLFNALKILGREVELLTVDNEDHYVSSPANIDKWQQAIMAWFARWLKDDPRWWNDTFNK